MDPLGVMALTAVAAVAGQAIYKQSQRDAEERRQQEEADRVRTAEERKAYNEKRRRWAEHVAEAESKSHFLVRDIRETYAHENHREVLQRWPAKREQYAKLKAEITTDPDYQRLARELRLSEMFRIHESELDVLRIAECLTESEVASWEVRQARRFQTGLKPAPPTSELTDEALRSMWEEMLFKPLDGTCDRLDVEAAKIAKRMQEDANEALTVVWGGVLFPLFYRRFVAWLKKDTEKLEAVTDVQRRVYFHMLSGARDAPSDIAAEARRWVAQNLATTEQGAWNCVHHVIEYTYNCLIPKLSEHEKATWKRYRDDYLVRLGHARTPEEFLQALY